MIINQELKFFQIEKIQEKKIAVLYLNQPQTRNTMSWSFWEELPLSVDFLDKDSDINVIIIATKKKNLFP